MGKKTWTKTWVTDSFSVEMGLPEEQEPEYYVDLGPCGGHLDKSTLASLLEVLNDADSGAWVSCPEETL